MTWTPLPGTDHAFALEAIAAMRGLGARLPSSCRDLGLGGDADRDALVGMLSEWIGTARAAGYGHGTEEAPWFPSSSDVSKSALFERIRSGRRPLAEPPPLGLSCPWYALVEEPDPHWVWTADFGADDTVNVFQNAYAVVERTGKDDFVVRDLSHDGTSYRFRLWLGDAPDGGGTGGPRRGWFMRNVALPERGS